MSWIARFYGVIFLWHAIRHFGSYALLGSQSVFSDPRPEWAALGILQFLVSAVLLYNPKPWHLIIAAIVLLLWCSAYPVGRHVGDSAFFFLLLGSAMAMLGGDGWIPLATLPSVIGLTLAAVWKIRGGNFSICDLTHCTIVRNPWMDWFDGFMMHHQALTAVLSDLVMLVELSAPFIWALLFFPKLWLIRSILALIPISLLSGIGITGNLDEFPWVMLTAWLMMLGSRQFEPNECFPGLVYPLAFVLYTASLFNLEINVRRIYNNETEFLFDKHIGLLPECRLKQMAVFMAAPYWNMYAGPIRHEQLFGAERSRLKQIQINIQLNRGCGLALNRWERIYWERVGRGLKDNKQLSEASALMSRYQLLEDRPCDAINFPPPFPPTDWITDYQSALASARDQNKLVLLHFTGSDWCPFCQILDREVLSQTAFQEFMEGNYIGVTLDYPRDQRQPDGLMQQNLRLAQEFGVDEFPTLIVLNPDGKELGRKVGYAPGGGPDAVISQLKSFK